MPFAGLRAAVRMPAEVLCLGEVLGGCMAVEVVEESGARESLEGRGRSVDEAAKLCENQPDSLEEMSLRRAVVGEP